MKKIFLSVTLFALPSWCMIMDVFECPKANETSFPKYGSSVDCQYLDIECAKTHQKNPAILEYIRNVKCEKHSLTVDAVKGSSELVLSILKPHVAQELLERLICEPQKTNMDTYYRLASANHNAYYTHLTCSKDLVKQLIDYVQTRGDHFSQDGIERVYNPSLFQGIWYGETPFLTNKELDFMLNHLLYAFKNDVNKVVHRFGLFIQGDKRENLRNVVTNDGTYKNYESGEPGTLVHFCQGYRQNHKSYVLINMDDMFGDEVPDDKHIRRVEAIREIIKICDDSVLNRFEMTNDSKQAAISSQNIFSEASTSQIHISSTNFLPESNERLSDFQNTKNASEISWKIGFFVLIFGALFLILFELSRKHESRRSKDLRKMKNLHEI